MIAQFKKNSGKQRVGAMLLLTVLACVILTNAYVAKADFEFGEPVKFGSAVAGEDGIDCLSSDGMELYFDSKRSGGQGSWDIWVIRRASIDKPWGSPQNLGPGVNSSAEDTFASISYDALALYFSSARPGGYGGTDIYVAKRATKNDPLGTAVESGIKCEHLC